MTDLELWEEADRIEIKREHASEEYKNLPVWVHEIIKQREYWEWKLADVERALYGVPDPRVSKS